MKTIRTAVVGVGIQGERHAQKLAALPGSELVAVVDVDDSRAKSVADGLQAEAIQDARELIGSVDAVVLSSPTPTHSELGKILLNNGIHLLIEKPITTTVEEARELIRLADEHHLVLQVGHLERFNPVINALTEQVNKPEFIESIRIAPFKPRSLDVSVVLDLMIHDIDLIHSFVRSPMDRVDAVGRPVFSDNIDIASARIQFADGCVANVTCSRISMKTERMLRMFQADSYVSADLQNKALTRYSRKTSGPASGPKDFAVDMASFGDSDAIMDQAQAFLDAIAGGTPPLVTGLIAMQALETATAVSEAMREQNRR